MRVGCPVNLVQPLIESGVVRVGEAAAGVDTMEEGLSLVVCGYPGTIGVRDLIVDPGEWAPSCLFQLVCECSCPSFGCPPPATRAG